MEQSRPNIFPILDIFTVTARELFCVESLAWPTTNGRVVDNLRFLNYA